MSLSPRWPYVVFDLDGTLVDTIGLIVDSYQHAFTTVLGAPEDEVVIRSWIGQPLIRAFRERSPERADELFATYIEWNHANTERLIRRYAGVDAPARRSRRRRSPVRGRDLEAPRTRRGGPAADRPGRLPERAAGPGHPGGHRGAQADPAPLLLAVERMGGTPAEAVYVGDAVVDVQAARRAGMAAVGVTWGAGARSDVVAARPDVVADTVDDLRAALLG